MTPEFTVLSLDHVTIRSHRHSSRRLRFTTVEKHHLCDGDYGVPRRIQAPDPRVGGQALPRDQATMDKDQRLKVVGPEHHDRPGRPVDLGFERPTGVNTQVDWHGWTAGQLVVYDNIIILSSYTGPQIPRLKVSRI